VADRTVDRSTGRGATGATTITIELLLRISERRDQKLIAPIFVFDEDRYAVQRSMRIVLVSVGSLTIVSFCT